MTGLVPISVAAGDIDGDGKADMAVVNDVGKSVAVFRNTSTTKAPSRLQRMLNLGTDFRPMLSSIGDVDGDGKSDVLVSDKLTTAFSVFRNTSTTGSVSFATRNDFLSESGRAIALGDLNGDGKPDVSWPGSMPPYTKTIAAPVPSPLAQR